MPLSKVFIQNFRLFDNKQLDLSNKNSLITGSNGSGKTTCLEALELLLTKKSSKTRNLTECVKKNQNSFLLGVQGSIKKESFIVKVKKTLNERLSFKAEIGRNPLKTNEIPICQLIQSKSLRMIEGEPELRRDLFSKTMFHVEHESYLINQRYKRTLNQRNRALKTRGSEKELKIWTDKLVEEGIELGKKNKDFFKLFYELSMEIIEGTESEGGLSFLKRMKIKLDQGWSDGISLKESFDSSLDKDKVLGYTTQGPHKLDLKFYIQEKMAKSILSRGQQKLLILLIYFNMDAILNERNKGGSIYLIDDIISELDKNNLRIALERLAPLKSQVIITSTSIGNGLVEAPILSEFNQINL